MAGHKELIKKLSEDDSLRQQILDAPTREGKHEVVRDAGLEVPDHHDVLQEVAGGTDDRDVDRRRRHGGAAAAAAAAAPATPVVIDARRWPDT